MSAAALMVCTALPFVWSGVNLTVRRLRTLEWPAWLACLFFVPYANFAFFAALCLKRTPSMRRPPETKAGGATPAKRPMLFTFALTAACMVVAVFATVVVKSYGWGLFIGVPFVTGFVPALAYPSEAGPTFRGAVRTMFYVQGLIALCFIIWQIEGVICLAMVAPISLLIGTIGVWLGLAVRRISAVSSGRTEIASVSILILPLLMFSERRLGLEPSLFEVSSRIEIAAPPERVWNSVVAFSDLPPPHELIFRAGVAYPMHAEISGQGVGAIRRCVFSTGAFIEPIIAWDEPSLLRFTVVSNPPPMRELSYAEIDPAHLHGFLESEQGQFQLRPLGTNKTELIGTTWYRHGLWPETYWQLWSDYIIHTIHLRVLRHIKAEAERGEKVGSIK